VSSSINDSFNTFGIPSISDKPPSPSVPVSLETDPKRIALLFAKKEIELGTSDSINIAYNILEKHEIESPFLKSLVQEINSAFYSDEAHEESKNLQVKVIQEIENIENIEKNKP